MNNPTIKEIASRAGVSTRAVSDVFNGKFKGVRKDALNRCERIQRIARELGYRPHGAARTMITGKTRFIGALLPNNSANPFHNLADFQIVLGINEAIQAVGYSLAFANIDEVIVGTASGHCRLFDEHIVDAIIVIGSMPDVVTEHLEENIDNCIWVNSTKNDQMNCISRDDFHAGFISASNVITKGYRRIIWFSYRDTESPWNKNRIGGLRHALREWNGDLIEITDTNPGNGQALPQKLAELLTPDTAAICNNVLFANIMTTKALAAGLIPGRDFALACCDGGYREDVAYSHLSRVPFDRMHMGRIAGEMALSVIVGNREANCSRIVKDEWYEGNTTPQYKLQSQI